MTPTGPAVALVRGLAALWGVLLVVLAATLTWTWVGNRRERRRTATREHVRGGLLERLRQPSPDWDGWVEGLDAEQRRVLRDLLAAYLRRLRGEDARKLRALAAALGLDERARSMVDSDDQYERLRGLTWLARLDLEVDPDWLGRQCADGPVTRAAAARVVHEQAPPDASRRGIDLLLSPGSALTTLGMDTLYQLNKVDPEPLLSAAAEDHHRWDPSLLVQVLDVVAECDPAPPDGSLSWVVASLGHDSDRVRASAIHALSPFGWHGELRASVPLDDLLADPSPAVRQATYRTLADWGDDDALARLTTALETAATPRDRLIAARGLAEHADRAPADVPDDEPLRWVVEGERGGGRP
jgi:hypothetical protein